MLAMMSIIWHVHQCTAPLQSVTTAACRHLDLCAYTSVSNTGSSWLSKVQAYV